MYPAFSVKPAATTIPITALLLLILMVFVPTANAQDDGIARVVYHADFADPRRFSAMLTSINNMVIHYNNELMDYDVRIVFIAHGIRFVTDGKLKDTAFVADPKLEQRRENLKGRLLSLNKVHDVQLELCDITRSQIGLGQEKVYPGVKAVPSGVVQIADLQQQGFAYIKIE